MAKKDPAEQGLAGLQSRLYEGIFTLEGDIMHYDNRNRLVFGAARHVSPEYYDYLARIKNFAEDYPMNDPHTWVPLVRARVNHRAKNVQNLMATDALRMAADDEGVPIGGATNQYLHWSKTPAPPVDPEQGITEPTEVGEEESSGGFGDFIGEVWDKANEAREFGTDTALNMIAPWRPIAGMVTGDDGSDSNPLTSSEISEDEPTGVTDFREAVRGFVGDVAEPVTSSGPVKQTYGVFKGAVRNFFDAARMPQQAIVGTAANMAQDASEGDYKSMLMHGFALNPVSEALFIAAENATGTDFYREDGEEQTNWSQTTFGQTILDLFGQGRGEQFGAYNDPAGIQAKQGEGFFTSEIEAEATPGIAESDPSSISQWQVQARLNANTLVEEQTVTDDNIVMPGAPWDRPETPSAAELNQTYEIIAKSQSTEEAEAWAETMGMTWSAEKDALIYPAQGFTFGRAVSGQFYDPHTYQYNLLSGIGDFVTNIGTDPLTYVPGGAIRAGGQTALGGGKIISSGDEAIKYARSVGTVLSQKDTQSLIARGTRAVDITPAGGRVVIRSRDTGDIVMTAGQIDADPRPISTLVREVGRLSTEKWDGFHQVGRAGEIDEVVAKTPPIRDWMLGAKTQTVTPNKYVAQLLGKRPDGTRRMTASQLEAQYPGSKLVLRDKTDGKVLAFAEDIDSSDEAVTDLLRRGNLRLEKFDFETTPEIDDALASTAPKAWRNPWVFDQGPGLVGIDRGQGGVWATESAMYDMQFGKLRPAVEGIAAEPSASVIFRKANGKIDVPTANALAKASTPDEVIEVLGPRLGAEINYYGDLQRFTIGMPAYSTWAGFTRAVDFHRLKDAWMAHVPGQSFMPTEFADMRDPTAVVHNLQKIGRVALTNFDNNPRMTAALDDIFDAFSSASSRSQRQGIYHAYAGRADDEVLMDAKGRVVMPAEDIKMYVSARMDAGVAKEKALEELIDETPDAVTIGKHGKDGFLTVLAKVLAEEEGVDPAVADQITRAWRRGDELYRQALVHERGGDVRAVGAEPISGAFTDADILGDMLIFPDARRLRGAISEYGKAVHSISEDELLGKLPHHKADEARQIMDDYLSWTVARWKEVALMAGGLRFPVYATKQVLDTQTTVLLNGGASILHRPMDLLKYLLTSEIRQAMRTRKGEKLRRARAVNKVGVFLDGLPTPIRSLVWPGDRMRDLPAGTSLEDATRKLMDGDPSFHDIGGTDTFNILTGGLRGGQGQDVLYGQAARRVETVEKGSSRIGAISGSGKIDRKYLEAHADEMYRMSRSEIFRRVASGKFSAERTADWFITHRDANGETMRDIISGMSRRLAVQLRTRQGVLDYLSERRQYLDSITGGSDELREIVASGGKIKVKGQSVPMLKGNRVTADRTRVSEYDDLLRRLDKDDATKLPETLRRSVSDRAMGRNGWNRMMSAMFASAGRWEDIYAREPYYRDMMSKHILSMGDVMLPSERASLAASLRRRGSPKLAGQLDAMTGRGVLTRSQVESVAVARAEKDIMEVAYNAANRREWAYAARILAPFVQAAVNGMYRWSKAAIKNPESSYRLLRAGHFLLSYDSAFISDWTASGGVQGNPFLYQDPTNKRYMVAVPLAGGILNQLVAEAGIDLPTGAEPSLPLPLGPLNQAAPMLADQLQTGSNTGRPFWKSFALGVFPGVGPFVTAPAATFANGTGSWEEWLLPYGVDEDQGGWERMMQQFVPGAVPRLLDQAVPSNEQMAQNGRRETVMMLWAAKEYGLDLTQQEDFATAKEIAARASTTMQWVQTFSTYMTPTPARIEDIYANEETIPGHMVMVQAMADVFNKYLEANPGDYAKAEAEMVSDYGVEILAAITPTGPNSDAAPPTNAMWALFKSDPQAYERFGPVLKYLATDRAGIADEFNSRMYQYQSNSKERTFYTLDERLEMARQNLLDFAYFEQMRRLESMGLSDAQMTAERNSLEDAMVEAEWAGMDIGTAHDRDLRAKLMWEAANTPSMQGVIGREAAANLRMYLSTRNKAIDQMEARGMSGDLAQSTTQPERTALFLLGENMALEDERFAIIWWRGLRSEVAPDSPKLEALLEGVA